MAATGSIRDDLRVRGGGRLGEEPTMVTVQFNPFTPEALANPYPLYHSLRQADPMHWSELMESWVLSRYDDIVAVLRDPRFSADRRRARSRLIQQQLAMEDQR